MLQTELDSTTPLLSMRNKDPASSPPKEPRYTIESHRNARNCVTFHSGFLLHIVRWEGYTVKVWDWEIGELERTIKGHTRAVLDVDYGGTKGRILPSDLTSERFISDALTKLARYLSRLLDLII